VSMWTETLWTETVAAASLPVQRGYLTDKTNNTQLKNRFSVDMGEDDDDLSRVRKTGHRRLVDSDDEENCPQSSAVGSSNNVCLSLCSLYC